VLRRKSKTVPRAAKTASWALMPIDSRPIRDQARREYQKVLRDLDQARQDLDQFEKQDKPAYSRWINRQLGALITELRETTQKVQASRELLFEIESEAYVSNCSHTRAYERVMWRKQHPEAEEPAEAKAAAGADADGSGTNGADPFAGFEEFFAGVDDDFAEAFGAKPGSGPLFPDSKPGRQAPARLKELYRAVVRRLHPDMHQTMTAQRKEWWHQAQAAYQSGDVDQLYVILTLCEIDEQGTTAKTSVSLLMRITRQFKSSLRTLKMRLRQCRHDPAWNFNNLRDPRALLANTERMLQAELSELHRALEAIESQIGCWARQARMARRQPARRGYSPSQPEFFF
jgi:hypothetical protein